MLNSKEEALLLAKKPPRHDFSVMTPLLEEGKSLVVNRLSFSPHRGSPRKGEGGLSPDTNFSDFVQDFFFQALALEDVGEVLFVII